LRLMADLAGEMSVCIRRDKVAAGTYQQSLRERAGAINESLGGGSARL
jgi:hypothetical protein